jgi:hypothetical protein
MCVLTNPTDWGLMSTLDPEKSKWYPPMMVKVGSETIANDTVENI